MTPEQTRLEADRAAPRAFQLWRDVTGMRSPLTFMQSGAHPDDETSGMLAALRFRDGLDVAYVCSTRGEGGQNDIGREAGAALGVLRTAEMERAADVLDMAVRWMTPAPGDPVHDFGFSKSGEETLSRWGHARTLDRFAHALRIVRPDMLCPTFLDVPGQHGHHRAMTLLAPEAIARAADPAWETEGLAPWRVPKLYLPAWSGAGQAYDDDLPPPPATVIVSGEGFDPVSGATWERIGQWSRAMHRTQGMGRWPGTTRDWPLHLVGGGPEAAVTDGLPVCWADLDWPGGARLDALVAEMIAALAHPDVVLAVAPEALGLVPEKDWRGARLRLRLHRVLFLAAGAEARGWAGAATVRPGAAVPIHVETRAGETDGLRTRLDLPKGWIPREDGVTVLPSVDPVPYPEGYDPLVPTAPALEVETGWRGTPLSLRLALDRTPSARPEGVVLEPEADVVNLARETSLTVRADGDLDLPEGWRQDGATLWLPADPGLHEIHVRRDGAQGRLVTEISAPHVPLRVLARPAILRLRALEVAVPDARVAVFGAGHDRVAHWLRRLGVQVSEPPVEALDDPQADTILLGVFALRFRDGLAARMPRVSDWVRGGGTLTTLYHRPWDAWDPAAMPAPLEIGQPSLRWRVTDYEAAVTHLAPDHPLLSGPNPIGVEDWQGWHKERGLYFAKFWDRAYTPLLEMSDPGEDPLQGALLSGQVGEGRHNHCALILHHQMEHLVPGAFRLMANLVAPV